MKKLIVLGGIICTAYFVLNLKPVDFMSGACLEEAKTLQQRIERIDHDLLFIRDTYTVTGRSRPGAFDDVKQRQDRYLADLDAFDHRCN